MNLYIAGNLTHPDVIIHAETTAQVNDTFAEILGYTNYQEMVNILGDELGKVNAELMYKE